MFLFFLDFENEEKLPRNVNVIIKIKMENYSVLINTIPHQLKILIRSLERCVTKVNNANWSTVFNETCMKDKISEVILVKSVSVEKSGLYAELKYKKEFD